MLVARNRGWLAALERAAAVARGGLRRVTRSAVGLLLDLESILVCICLAKFKYSSRAGSVEPGTSRRTYRSYPTRGRVMLEAAALLALDRDVHERAPVSKYSHKLCNKRGEASSRDPSSSDRRR